MIWKDWGVFGENINTKGGKGLHFTPILKLEKQNASLNLIRVMVFMLLSKCYKNLPAIVG